MSDEELSVECGEHGKSPATFVCQHLPAGENQGFNVGYDPEAPDDAYPDAWCDQCDAVLEQDSWVPQVAVGLQREEDRA